MDVNRWLALRDLRADGRQWILIPVVFFLAAILVTLPTNLLTTFESPRFMTYMGTPESDLRADLQFSDDVDIAYREILASMQNDERLTDVRDFANVLHETRGLGIAGLDFIPNPMLVYVTYPAILIAAGYVGAVALTTGLRDADKSAWLRG